ncbi:hypothetical protein SAMN05428967_2253 [Phyllobacterium sp. YR620]|uniref:hypothetical protein n=1 Tax=Phyllobacterium sp. YR620 TaxID=1881066 RepID=UPI00088F58FD|nr:hypothetical protein [Phyllobacterium sp. YR620]SDP46802.1 hypothetical protein SAMN05428967_2253 [Phyllobacterium sp. YR620]
MKILYCHPTRECGKRDCIAFVDVELNEHIRLYGLRLVKQPDGNHMLYAPQAGQRRSATFSTALAKRLTALAVEALEVRQ